MTPERNGASDPMPDIADLLAAAQWSNLRASTAADLRHLVRRLEIACEAARVAALRNMLALEQRMNKGGATDQNCGFARLFTALRRARSEMKRRGKEPARLLPTPSKESTKRAVPARYAVGGEKMALAKAWL